jgi:hypothetical protein
MLLAKSLWKDWAAAWSLSHRPQKGTFYRDEQVAGLRDGLLFHVCWTGEKGAMLSATFRFSPGQDLERVRAALIADSALDALPGKGKGRNHAKIEKEVKKVYIGALPEFSLLDGQLIWRRTFAWGTPKSEQVRGWVECLLGALTRAGLRHEPLCEDCRQRPVDGYVLVNGLPARLCTSCQHARSAAGDLAERSYALKEAQHARGMVFAFGGMLLGAAVWAAIAIAFNRMFAMVGIGTGALVAWAYQKGAGKADLTGKVIAGLMTVLAVAIGNVLFTTWAVAQARPDIGFNLAIGLATTIGLIGDDPRDAIVSLLFGLVGAWVAVSALQKPKLAPVIEQPGTQDHRSAA